MPQLEPPVVRLSPDRKIALMRRGKWKMRERASQLPNWLQLYRRLAAKRPEVYGAWLLVIEEAMTKAGLQIPPHGARSNRK